MSRIPLLAQTQDSYRQDFLFHRRKRRLPSNGFIKSAREHRAPPAVENTDSIFDLPNYVPYLERIVHETC